METNILNKYHYKRLLPKQALELLNRFQLMVVFPYIKKYGSLEGYKRQIHYMMPKFDKRLKLYKKVNVETYEIIKDYLRYQSQRYWRHKRDYSNYILEFRRFKEADHNYLCKERVWHNGVTTYNRLHSASQLVALREGITKYGFKYYENDYNFSDSNYYHFKQYANPKLINYYSKILKEKFLINKGEFPK